MPASQWLFSAMGCRLEDGGILNQEQGYIEILSVAHSKHAPVIAILGFLKREVAIAFPWEGRTGARPLL
jgi:hypothetical protein